jgi:hypothetical protein
MIQTYSSEADERYLAEIRADCANLMGAGAELLDLHRDPTATGVKLVARIRIADAEGESVGEGESMVAAHTALRTQIVLDRIRLSLSAIVQANG